MASYQRTALFVFFDEIERDLVEHIRSYSESTQTPWLNDEERTKARKRLQSRGVTDSDSDLDLLYGLDLGDKYAIIMRYKDRLPSGIAEYFRSKQAVFEKAIPIRNSTMHGRPLTTEEFSIGFTIARDFIRSPSIWPSLSKTYIAYGKDPDLFLTRSITFWDEPPAGEALNNLPQPDYDDTGFQPRKSLEAELKKKILGRHPVLTVLGDGGDGKTALTLQTLYSMLYSNDHDFDAIIWVSAKTNRLTLNEIQRIEGAISTSIGLFDQIADQFEPGSDSSIDRVRRLLAENKILLAIDNLETVLDSNLIELASDVPGESKIVFTSRVPLGSDLSIRVPPFSESESLPYLRRLIEAYDIGVLRQMSDVTLRRHLTRLLHKPLLVKWFAIGVASGLDPARITIDPALALQFCMENVFDKLGVNAKSILSVMVIIPSPLSAALLSHIAFLETKAIEDGLAQLMRFGLINRTESVEFESLWRLQPVARSYLTRVVKLSNPDSDKIAQRFRQVSSAFQDERGLGQKNKYAPRFYTVRSPSEAVVAGKLRHATNLSFKGKFDEAYKIVDDLKISSPEYFEIYRVQAYIQFRQGNFPEAQNSYSVALELAGEQPQLYFFYGGFLLRAFEDLEGAVEQFNKALSMNPNEFCVLRDAARVCLYLHRFDEAQRHIDVARSIEDRSLLNDRIIADLQAQLHIRSVEHNLALGLYDACFKESSEFHNFLKALEPSVVDDTMIWHLDKSVRTFESLKRVARQEDVIILDSVIYFIGRLEPVEGRGSAVESQDRVLVSSGHTGKLKQQGLKPDFGFIRDTFNVDTYVARNAVSESLWADLCAGRTVKFDVYDDGTKTWADNVVLV